jgi:NRPS condensation-like uncharacterized protein
MNSSFPLTTMEEFMYWEDRPAFPCLCFIRLKFSGCLDRTAFETAVRTVLPRHPLLTAKIESRNGKRLRWSVAKNAEPQIQWENAVPSNRLPPAKRLDLHTEIGIRFHVRAKGAASDLTIQFHHACSDGAGISQFVQDLLVAYAMTCGMAPEQTQLPTLDSSLLSGRGRFGLTLRKFLRMMPQQAVGLLGARQFLMRQPVPLVPHRVSPNDSRLPATYPAILHYVFDRETTKGFRAVSKHLGVTANDLMARDLFLALAEWRSRQGVVEEGQWLRMMVPMNLRRAEDYLMPAANVVSCVFLDRREAHFADADRLLQGIHEEMDLIKRLQLGFTFIFSTALCRYLPGGLKERVQADVCSTSCVFTNVGTFLGQVPLPRRDGHIVAGNVTLMNVDFVAPIHPYACVTLAVGTYADRLTVSFHYDPRPLTQQQAADLLNTFVARIRDSVGQSIGPRFSSARKAG